MKVRPKLLTVSCITFSVLTFSTSGCVADSTGPSTDIAALSGFAIDFVRQIIAAFLF